MNTLTEINAIIWQFIAKESYKIVKFKEEGSIGTTPAFQARARYDLLMELLEEIARLEGCQNPPHGNVGSLQSS